MKRALLALVVIVAGTAFAPPASATKPDVGSSACSYYLYTKDPRFEPSYDAMLTEMDGGPILQNGTITCTIKTGGPSTHAAPYEFGTSVSATGTLGVTVLPATPISFVAHSYPIYLCSQFTDSANVTWYLDTGADDWTTDPDVGCDLAISSATPDPIYGATWNLLHVLGQGIDNVRDIFLKPAACPVLALLSPGVPPLVDVRPDGDTSVAGDLVVDCPPGSADDGGFGLGHRLPGTWPWFDEGRWAGAIRIVDTGTGPEWSVAGTLVSVDWDCGFDGSAVVCDWDGYWAKPECRSGSAMAAVLAPASRARTRVSCVRGTAVESATTGVASAELPATYAERVMTALPVTSVRCAVDDGTGGPPVAPYTATCGFTF